MTQDTAASGPLSLSLHCECDRHSCNGEVVEISTASAKEIFLRCDPASIRPGSPPGQQAESFYSCLPRILDRAGAVMSDVVSERVFFRNLARDHAAFDKVRRMVYHRGGVSDDVLPVVSYLEQPPCNPRQAFELQVYAVVPQSTNTGRVSTIPAQDELPRAKIVELDGFRHLYARGITGICHDRPSAVSFREQSDEVFARAVRLLERHDGSYRDVIRTWCYLNDIDRDYHTLNESRNEFFQRQGVDRYPASTGIQAGLHPPHLSCGLDLHALLNPDGAAIEVLRTDKANEAPSYGSSFSRGIKIRFPEKTVVYLSGTASVDETGATAHVGDARRQIERMLLNIETLLTPHGAGFRDLAQVISYLNSPDDLELFRAVGKRWGLTDLPNSIVQAGSCRPDLLCELEAIAILPNDGREESDTKRVGQPSGLADAYVIRCGVQETEIPDRMNAVTMFVDDHLAAGRGSKTAILCEDRKVSYRDLYEDVNRVGNALRSLDLQVEERVAVLLPDSPEWVFTFFGAMKIGAVGIPLNTTLKPADYEYVLNDSRARVLFVHQSLLPHIDEIQERLEFLKHVIVVGGDADDTRSLQRFMRDASPALEPAPTSKDEAAFWLYSSGTTGPPKAAIHLHHDMLVEADLYSRGVLGLKESDISFSVAKLFFAFGLGNGLYFPLRAGATTVLLPDRPTPEKVFEVIDRYQPTVFYSVPTSYVALLHHSEVTGRRRLDSIRLCISAGEPLPRQTFDEWQARFGIEILDGIGSTEILHIYISNRPGRAVPGSTGQIVPGYEAKIVDETGAALPPGQVGTLLIKGDSIAAGYWNKHEQTKDTFCGHWINTHDKFSVDEEGYFWYAGRTDDMFKVSGQAVWPADVESVLMRHEAVLESGVVGARGADGLVKPVAFVVLKRGCVESSELKRELQDFVKRTTSPHKYPRTVVFVSSLPKTATGKIRRFQLREMAAPTALGRALADAPGRTDRPDRDSAEKV